MNSLIRLLPVFAIAAVVIAPSPSFAVERDCNNLLFDIAATVPTQQTTSSDTFVNLPGASITFESGAGCVIVQFSAQVRAKLPEKVRIRAVLVGETTAFPAVEWYTSSNEYDGRSATFIFPNATVGIHTIRIQFLSVAGGTVGITKGLLSIRYVPAI